MLNRFSESLFTNASVSIQYFGEQPDFMYIEELGLFLQCLFLHSAQTTAKPEAQVKENRISNFSSNNNTDQTEGMCLRQYKNALGVGARIM